MPLSPITPANQAACAPCLIDTTPCSADNNTHNVPFSNTMPCNPNINTQYFPEQFLTPMAGNIMPMKKVFQDQFRGVADFFFDYEEAVNDRSGKVESRLVFKNLPNISLGDFYDGNFITRGEWYFKPTDFFITINYLVATNTVQVGNAALVPGLGSDYTTFGSGLLQAGDTIIIYRNDPNPLTDDPCCEDIIQRTILSVNPVTSEITLEPGTPAPGFTFKQGDRIKKLYHGRQDCTFINNTFGMVSSTAKRSYVQHFGYTIDFKKCDLNKAYATPKGAMDFVANRIFHGNLELVRQMVFAAWRGRNRGDVCVQNQTVPAETQGIITGITDANALNPSLNLITSLQNAVNDDDKVRHILDELLKIQSSGLVNTGDTITMVCNQKALAALLKMNNAWNKFTGWTVQKTDNVNKDFTLPIIQTPNGRTELKYDQILTELYPNEGVIVFVPKNLIAMRTRRNSMYDYTNGNMVSSTLGVTIKEVTEFKQHECRSFDVFTEMAILIQGLDSGAWRMIQGIRC